MGDTELMSREGSDVVLADLRSIGLPEGYCLTTVQELMSTIANNFKAVVPKSITNVLVSNQQPTSTERDSIWFRQSNSGTFIGIYVFDGTTWQQVFPGPGAITRINGNSATPPAGYEVITNTKVGFNAADVTALQAENLPAGPAPRRVYWATFVGF